MRFLPLADGFSVTWPRRNTLLPCCYKVGQDNISQSKHLISRSWMYWKFMFPSTAVETPTCRNTENVLTGKTPAAPNYTLHHCRELQGQGNLGFHNDSQPYSFWQSSFLTSPPGNSQQLHQLTAIADSLICCQETSIVAIWQCWKAFNHDKCWESS